MDLSNLTGSRQNSLLWQPMTMWCPSYTYLYSQKLVPCGQILRRWCWPPPGALWQREEFGKARSNQPGTWLASHPTAPVPNSFPMCKGSEGMPWRSVATPNRKSSSQSRKCCFTIPVKTLGQFTILISKKIMASCIKLNISTCTLLCRKRGLKWRCVF